MNCVILSERGWTSKNIVEKLINSQIQLTTDLFTASEIMDIIRGFAGLMKIDPARGGCTSNPRYD